MGLFSKKMFIGFQTIKDWCNANLAAKSHGTHVSASTCVTSVNDKTGKVTLTASMVSATGMPNFSMKTAVVDENNTNLKDNKNHVIRNAGYVTPSDGWFMLDSRGHDDATSALYVNGTLMFQQNNDYGSMGVHIFMPAPKGTRFKYVGTSGSIRRAWFFPVS